MLNVETGAASLTIMKADYSARENAIKILMMMMDPSFVVRMR